MDKYFFLYSVLNFLTSYFSNIALVILCAFASDNLYANDEKPMELPENSYLNPVAIRQFKVIKGYYDQFDQEENSVSIPFSGSIEGLNNQSTEPITLKQRIKLPFAGLWAIYLPDTKGNAVIYIDGQAQPQRGRVQDLEREVLTRGNKVVFFEAEKDEFELAISIRNWHNPVGPGILHAPLISSPDKIMSRNRMIISRDQFMLGILFIMSIYHIALHLLRPLSPANVYLAGFCFATGFRSLLYGDGRYFFELWPNFDGEWSWKLELVSLYISLPLAHFFASEMIPKEIPKWTSKLLFFISMPFAALSLVLDTRLVSTINIAYQVILFVVTIQIIIYSSLAMLRKREGSFLYGASILILASAVIHDLMRVYGYGFMESDGLVVFGIILFVFNNSIIISRQFSSNFQKVEEAQVQILKLTKKLERRVEEQTSDIKSMMKTIRQGIFTIQEPGVYEIGDHYSPFLEELLGRKNLAGCNALDAVFSKTDLSDDQCAQIAAVLDSSLEEEEFSWDINNHLLPSSLNLKIGKLVKKLEIDWNPVFSQGKVEKILVSIRDMTLIKKLEFDSKRNEMDMRYISEIVKISPDKFEDLIHQTQACLKENRRLLHASQEFDPEILKIMFINLHTLKGVCRSYDMKIITSVIHSSEQRLAQIQSSNGAGWDKYSLLVDLKQINQSIDNYIRLSEEKLGHSSHSDKTVVCIDRQLYENQFQDLLKVDKNKLDIQDQKSFEDTITNFKKILYESLESLIEEFFKPIESYSKYLGIHTPNIKFSHKTVTLNREEYQLLKSIFLHILRNSLRHGFERGGKRIAKGKSAKGNISINVFCQQDRLTRIEYADDGRGLPLSLLRDQYRAQKNLSSEDTVNDEDLASFVFEPGVSTVNGSSSNSLHGVGLGAVKQYLTSQGGMIHLVLTDAPTEPGFRSFTFHIEMPKRFSYLKAI